MSLVSYLKPALLAGAFLSVSACSVFDKEEEPERDFMAEIRMHAATFSQEAALRQVEVDSMMALIKFITSEEVIFEGRSLCGFAPWYDDPETGEPTITIVTSETCWINRPEEDNEALVFHELGHMVLDRDHRDDLLPSNSRSSIMVGSNLAGLYVGNATSRRDYYIDELFDPATPVPDWGQ